MSLEIYTPDLTNRHGIPVVEAISMDWWYNKIGRCTVVVSATAENRQNIVRGSLLYDVARDVTFTIRRVRYDSINNTITANGYTANWLINQRVAAASEKITRLFSGVYGIVSKNLRGLPGVTIAQHSGEDPAIEHTAFGGQLLDAVIPVLDAQQAGHRMDWDDDTRQHTFQLYKGRDLTKGIHAVIFSEQRGTAKNLVLDQDDSTLKNVFYIQMLYKNGNTKVLEVATGDPQDRREYWIKSAIRQQSKESDADFEARAKSRCKEEAEKRLNRQTFNANIDPKELGSVYRIGDLVSCVSESLGLSFNARITGARYTQDLNGFSTSVILGEPTLTIFDEVIMS